jgi:two-component system, cell cycle response regulator DivK
MPVKNPNGHTILVVEDHPDARQVIKVALELRGYNVVEASNGSEAVDIAIREKPDLVIMDLDLPIVDGIAATSQMRKYADLYDVPIIAVTGKNSEFFSAAAFAAGCNEYVNKPVDFAFLNNLISSLIAPVNKVK